MTRGLMLWAIYAIPLVVAIRPVAVPVLDPDIWWHLAVGGWVVEHRAVPSFDPFSQLGRPWVAYSWLYEVLMFALDNSFGLAGVIAYRAAMALAVVAAVHALVRRLEHRFLVATALTAAAVLPLAMLFSERPWLFTVLFSTLTLHAVVALRRGDAPRWIWILPLLYVLWANIHIQFIYGLALLALGCVTSPFDRRMLTLAALCFLATFLNPYHAQLYFVVVEYATQPGPFRWVAELKALEFREVPDWVTLALTLSAWFALGRKGGSAFEFLLLAAGAFCAFRARRDLWFAILAALVVLSSLGPEEVSDGDRYRLSWPGFAALAAGLALVAAFRIATQDLSPKALTAAVATRFPAAAAEHVKRNNYPGPLFNDFNWGGYFTWALPGYPVAIDGRTNLHGDERLDRFGQVWAGLDGWRDDPDLSRAGVVIAPADSALSSLLQLDPRFHEVYSDDLARVFVPTTRKP